MDKNEIKIDSANEEQADNIIYILAKTTEERDFDALGLAVWEFVDKLRLNEKS